VLHRIVYHAVFHVPQVLREARSRSVVFVVCYRSGSGIETNSFDYTGCALDIIAMNFLNNILLYECQKDVCSIDIAEIRAAA